MVERSSAEESALREVRLLRLGLRGEGLEVLSWMDRDRLFESDVCTASKMCAGMSIAIDIWCKMNVSRSFPPRRSAQFILRALRLFTISRPYKECFVVTRAFSCVISQPQQRKDMAMNDG